MIASKRLENSTRESLLSRRNWLNMAIMCAGDHRQRKRLKAERELLARRLGRCAA